MQSLNVNGALMTYSESGDPKAPTLFLLSGWCQDHRLFKSLAPLLARDFHVICPDWRGHDSKQTDSGDFGSQTLAEDLLAFIDAKGIGDFHMVSTSHGCWVNIDVCERLGAARLPKTIVIDWLLQPHPGFWQQLAEGQHPTEYVAGRQSFFDEWAEATDNADVLNHLRNEMPWFHGEMWQRACREIEANYRTWGSPLERMVALPQKPDICHIYSQPLSQDYRQLQLDFAAGHAWFHPRHVPGRTHFPSLENPAEVAQAIGEFLRG
ncbi:alpha/beta hydrolase [Pseudomonas synxantha]|nr:alpha/beta hydrolase [Pseudomonas synxantha]